MSLAIPRVYTSFAEFEREELRRLDGMHSIDDLMEERFSEDMETGGAAEAPRKRGRPRKYPR